MNITTFFIVVAVLQLVSAVWLVTRGRKVGFFFGLVAVSALVSTAIKGGAL